MLSITMNIQERAKSVKGREEEEVGKEGGREGVCVRGKGTIGCIWLAPLLTSNSGDDENREEVDDSLPGL